MAREATLDVETGGLVARTGCPSSGFHVLATAQLNSGYSDTVFSTDTQQSSTSGERGHDEWLERFEPRAAQCTETPAHILFPGAEELRAASSNLPSGARHRRELRAGPAGPGGGVPVQPFPF